MILLPQHLQSGLTHEQFIVWNVGQGLWTTHSSVIGCVHVDMGGEFAPFAKIQKLCAGKPNYLFLSHWDSDHSRFISRFQKRISEVCLLDALAEPQKLRRKIVLRPCRQHLSKYERLWQGAHSGSQNDQSHVVFNWKFRALLPGDSPSAQERRWLMKVPRATRVLLLGHHGSRTSTSAGLLARLPQLKMAIASARKKKYGHPHAETQNRLKKYKIPLLKTEDWGNFIFLD